MTNDLSTALRSLRLVLSPDDLAALRATLGAALREGALRDGQAIAMLPAWLAPPRPGLAGEAVAIDAGGTNLRAARVAVREDGTALLVGAVEEAPLPGSAGRKEAEIEAFFAAHVELHARLGAPPGSPIGYCFSYPTRVLPDGDAVLLRWTKEVRVNGVVGARVGSLLQAALGAAGLAPGPVFVLNDTIATLAAGSLGPALVPSRTVGLIVGTGTNLGAYLPLSRLRKVSAPSWPSPLMAVNFESGAFSPPGLGPVDEEVDRRSRDPGAQRFEKAVSGAYLGQLFAAAAPRLALAAPSTGDAALATSSAEVSRLAEEEPGSPAGQVARALLDRSADLVAAALAATSDLLGGEGDLRVAAEGSLITKGPGYADRLRATLDAMLVGDGRAGRARLLFQRDPNLVGSALAALARGGG